jgi:predicted dithiol-disulfide oxidoreductase (DUF899 family)
MIPNETPDYRQARERLAQAERALLDQVEEVAALRRQLPLGGVLKEDYAFSGGSARFSELFAPSKDTLLIYSYMFNDAMETPCPMCTSFLDGLNNTAPHLKQHLNVAVVAQTDLSRLEEVARSRSWTNVKLLSSKGTTYHQDYLGEDPTDVHQIPMLNVFVRREGVIHHFWASELALDYGRRDGDPRHLDIMWPLWNLFDVTPGGRPDWYPALSYDTDPPKGCCG